jgi:hypothetical protein
MHHNAGHNLSWSLQFWTIQNVLHITMNDILGTLVPAACPRPVTGLAEDLSAETRYPK